MAISRWLLAEERDIMTIQEQIDARLKEAMIAKDEEATGLYRLLKSALKNAEIEKRADISWRLTILNIFSSVMRT